MKVTLQCSVALKHHEGVAFGSALWMDGDRIQFEANARIKDGEICEMRMELRGYKETVYGRVRIGKMIRRGGEATLFLGQITQLDGEDKERLDRWVKDLEAGGTALDPTRAIEEDLAEREMGGSATAEEIDAVLERIDERRSRSRFRKAKFVPTLGLDVEDVEGLRAPDTKGRLTLREALRQAGRQDHESIARMYARALALHEEAKSSSEQDQEARTGPTQTSLSWFQRSMSLLKDRKPPSAEEKDKVDLEAPGFDDNPNATASLDDMDFLKMGPVLVAGPNVPVSATSPPPTPEPSSASPPPAEDVFQFDFDAHRAQQEQTVGAPDIQETEPGPEPDPEPETSPESETSPEPEPEPTGPAPPVFQLDLANSLLCVEWNSRASFASSWEQSLRHLGLQVPADASPMPRLHQSLSVHLVPPGHPRVIVEATVVAHLPSAFGLGLSLSNADRQQLEKLAESARPKTDTEES